MSTQEIATKKKKGFMSFYKSISKGRLNPKPQPDKPTLSPLNSQYNSNLSHYMLSPMNQISSLPQEPASMKKSKDFQEADVARKSVSHVEANAGSTAAFLSVKVLVADMPAFMQAHAFKCARRTFDSLEKFSSKHIAFNLKKEFDKVYGPAWHCIVGSSFGSFVTHSTGCFLYFSMEKLYILVFRTKVHRALDK